MRRQSSGENDDLKKMLSAVLMLCMSKRTLSQADLNVLITDARRDAKRRIRTLQFARAETVDAILLGSVLHRWHRNPDYLDSEARPVPIRESGPAPSVQALFKQEKGGKEFRRGLRFLRSQGIVRQTRSGLLVPRTDTMMFHTLTQELVENVSMAIYRLISTLSHNMKIAGASRRLIERNAIVLDLPKSRIREFRAFSREQGVALVSTINDWLESRRDVRSRGERSQRRKTATAGVHVFAFCDEN